MEVVNPSNALQLPLSLLQYPPLQIIPNHLYFIAFHSVTEAERVLEQARTATTAVIKAEAGDLSPSSFDPLSLSSLCFISLDAHVLYQPFQNDFGPVNIGDVHRFCTMLEHVEKKLEHGKRIICYCADQREAMSNAAVLIGAYLIINKHMDATQAYSTLKAAGL